MDGGYGIYAGAKRHWATLVFQAQAAQWVSREEWHPDQAGKWLGDGRYELKVPYSSDTEIIMDILRHGDHVFVVLPEGLRKSVAARLSSAVHQYSPSDLSQDEGENKNAKNLRQHRKVTLAGAAEHTADIRAR